MSVLKPVKVLHIVSVEKQNYYLANLFNHSDKKQVEFFVAAFTNDQTEFLADIRTHGINAVSLGFLSRTHFLLPILNLIKLVDKVNPDIVHCHLFWPSIVGALIGKWKKKKIFITRHHSDALYKINSAIKRLFYLLLEKLLNYLSDVIIAPSKEVKRILLDRENVPQEKVFLVPYGQDLERFSASHLENPIAVRKEFQIGDSLMLVCVSRLYKMKGHKYLLEALAKLPEIAFKLILVGEGDYKNEIESIANDLKLKDKIIFAGWRADALSIMAAADIIVHPSLEDALSSALIEAIMLEKPVVATDISGAADTLCNGKFGKLVKAADSEDFYRALLDTIEHLAEAKEAAKNGRKFLTEYMDAQKVSSQYEALYRKALTVNEKNN